MRYRKKPVEVNAWRIRELCVAARDDWDTLPQQIKDAHDGGVIRFRSDMCVEVATLEGVMRGGPDDMLIHGVRGELYPCKPDIFFETYEEIEPWAE